MTNARKILLWLSLLLSGANAFASEARLELGAFKTVSNRFNIPNPGGSRFLVESGSPQFYGRGEFLLSLSENGFLRFLVAPLSEEYDFRNPGISVFNGTTFPANADLRVSYRFNSYRLGYIHNFNLGERFKARVGAVGKIRDAKITVASGALSSTYKNVGFVPLLNLGFRWNVYQAWELRFDLDGAAAPQGRAFDGRLEAFYALNEKGSGLSGGFRILEGGADNEKVNTFALVDYLFLSYTHGF